MADQLLERPDNEHPSQVLHQDLRVPRRVAEPAEHERRAKRHGVFAERIFLWVLSLACVVLLAWGVMLESQYSFLQSIGSSRLAAAMSFTLSACPNAETRLPQS